MSLAMEISTPKDLLEKDIPIKVGDFVTTTGRFQDVEAYVVKAIHQSTTEIYGLELTSTQDDVNIHNYCIASRDLIYLDESFITVDSILWKIRDMVLAGVFDHMNYKPTLKFL